MINQPKGIKMSDFQKYKKKRMRRDIDSRLEVAA